jgi:hypothetical protein
MRIASTALMTLALAWTVGCSDGNASSATPTSPPANADRPDLVRPTTESSIPPETTAPATLIDTSRVRAAVIDELMAAGVDVDAAPASLLGNLSTERVCPTRRLEPGGTAADVSDAGPRCLADTIQNRRPAFFIDAARTVEGDPIVTVYRTGLDGSIRVFIDSTRDRFGSRAWEMLPCSPADQRTIDEWASGGPGQLPC